MNNESAAAAKNRAVEIMMTAYTAGIRCVELDNRFDEDGWCTYDIELEHDGSLHSLALGGGNSSKEDFTHFTSALRWVKASTDSSHSNPTTPLTPGMTRLFSNALHSGWDMNWSLDAYQLQLQSPKTPAYYSWLMGITTTPVPDWYEVDVHLYESDDPYYVIDEDPHYLSMSEERLLKWIGEQACEQLVAQG